jgi:2-alkyl-3-oxoalkanoate reductase
VKILITGASGFVGSAVAEQLALLGHEVRPLLRRTAKGSSVRGGALSPALLRGGVSIDAWRHDALAQAASGCDVVVHAASIVHRPDASPADYERFNVIGTQSLVRAAKLVGIQRLVFISSIKIYGEEPAQVMDEDAPPLAVLPYAETKRRAEAIALAADFPEGQVVLRLAPVYGVGDKGNIRKMIERVARRQLVIPGTGDTQKSIVHIGTVVRAIIKAALWPLSDSPRAEPLPSGAFVVANTVAPSVGMLADLIARILRRRSPARIPERWLAPLARVIDACSQSVPQYGMDISGLIRKSLLPTVCDPAKLRNVLGVGTDTDLEDNLREEITWLRQIKAIR